MKKQLICMLGLGLAAAASAKVYYVKPDASSTAWASAPAEQVYTSLPTAHAVMVAGDEVWLAEGTYPLSTALMLKAGTGIYGGFAGTETSKDERVRLEGGQPWDFVHRTIITREESLTASNLINQATQFSAEAIVDGITFEKSIGSAVTVRKGGHVRYCILRDNISTWGGGGVQMYTGGKVEYCYFLNNESRSDDRNGGAGLYASSNSLDDMNYVENCVFEGNRGLAWDGAKGGGGLRANAAVKVANCVFYNNTAGTAENYGKGSAFFSVYPSNEFYNCLAYNNSGYPVFFTKGGTVINATICNNLSGADSKSYSVYAAGSDLTVLANTVVWGNKDATGAQALIYAAAGSATTSFSYFATENGQAGIKCAVANQTYDDLYTLAADNIGTEEGRNYVRFIAPTSFVGATTDAEKIAELRAAIWSTDNASFLIDRGCNDWVSIEYDTDVTGRIRPLTEADPADLGAYEMEKDDPTAILSTADGPAVVFARDGHLHLQGAEGQTTIYDATGRLVGTIQASDAVVPLAGRGLFIVRTQKEGKTILQKVIL